MTSQLSFYKHDQISFFKCSLICIALELAAQYLRLPIYPGWVPLIFWAKGKIEFKSFESSILIYTFGVAALTFYFQGINSLDYTLSFTSFSLILFFSKIRRLGTVYSLLILTTIWCLFSILLSSFPTGSIGLEVFFTAVFTRVLKSEYIGAVLSRLFLIALTYALIKIASVIKRKLSGGKKTQALVLGAVLLMCSCQKQSSSIVNRFSPARDTNSEQVISFFNDEQEEKEEHIVIDEDIRNRETCVGCHAEKVKKSKLPKNKKNFHEIHFAYEKIDKDCTFCHESAGLIGFPALLGKGDRRTQYNQKCISCHSKKISGGKKRLSWQKRYW
ncbi:MAG: hypothetical protein HOE90_21515 [Bacteriovoracaceae bacterium]|jgi:hypothetical protein|nr:hypothetical protein [Bacteriovoracaceae bacterium]